MPFVFSSVFARKESRTEEKNKCSKRFKRKKRRKHKDIVSSSSSSFLSSLLVNLVHHNKHWRQLGHHSTIPLDRQIQLLVHTDCSWQWKWKNKQNKNKNRKSSTRNKLLFEQHMLSLSSTSSSCVLIASIQKWLQTQVNTRASLFSYSSCHSGVQKPIDEVHRDPHVLHSRKRR